MGNVGVLLGKRGELLLEIGNTIFGRPELTLRYISEPQRTRLTGDVSSILPHPQNFPFEES